MSNESPSALLSDIRQIMDRSSRFLSLSGLSGVAAGFWALAGAGYFCWRLDMIPGKRYVYLQSLENMYQPGNEVMPVLLGTAIVTLVGAILSAWYFSYRKARRAGATLWDRNARRLAWHFFLPMTLGGGFVLGLLVQGYGEILAPATLLVYGLSLLHAGKYTLSEIQSLGIAECLLALVSVFFIGFGLLFWVLGFGLLHIIYGIGMYCRYERNH